MNDREVARLQREVNDLKIKLARGEAEKLVNTLKAEGIIFGDTPEEAAQGEADEVEYLSMLEDEDRQYQANNVIRKRYKRKERSPAEPAYPGVARYARSDVSSPEGDDDYEPATPQEASDFADLITLRKLSRADAIKFMRKRRK